MKNHLRNIGKALMLPVAALPIGGILLRFGVLWNIVILEAAGSAIFDNMPLLFALSIAAGLARDNNGSAVVSTAFAYYVFNTVGLSLMPAFDTKILGGLLIGFTVTYTYNRYSQIKLPDFFAFFAGQRLIPIISIFIGLFYGILFGYGWPVVQAVIDNIAHWITQARSLGDFTYGFLNRLLIPFGLHHVVNDHVWYNFGSFADVAGDLHRFYAGDLTAGLYMTGFFPVTMFGLPAAALAMIVTAKEENKQLISGAMVSVAFTAFLTGITEPIEFLFMFMAPLLYVTHAVLTGLSMVIVNLLGIRNGFTFSAGAVDFIENMTKGFGEKPLLLLAVSLGMGLIYFLTFKFLIERFNIMTPGRDNDVDYVNADTNTITAVAGFADRIAAGDLDFEMDESLLVGEGAVGNLARAFDKMQINLLNLVREMKAIGGDLGETSNTITDLTSQFAENSKAISEAVEDVTKGAYSQAADTEKGSSESYRLGEMIEGNINRIRVLNDDSVSINSAVIDGKSQVNELNNHASETKKSLDEIKAGIEETYQSVNKIREVSSFIAGISEQTNLLALNASIEAARAGEAGRGFSVVAEEIRNLAEVSKSSTEEIDEVVRELSNDAKHSVDIALELDQVVNKQLLSVTNTSEKMDYIETSINNMTKLIGEMNLSTGDMEETKDNIVGILENLSSIAEENAAATEETSASTSEQTAFINTIHDRSMQLLELVHSVNETTNFYKVRE